MGEPAKDKQQPGPVPQFRSVLRDQFSFRDLSSLSSSRPRGSDGTLSGCPTADGASVLGVSGLGTLHRECRRLSYAPWRLGFTL